jgi:hypothetical protein
MLRMWLAAVCSEITSRAPISRLLRPSATSARICTSRGESGDVADFVLAPNAAIYLADQEEAGRRELYRAGLGGGARAKLSVALKPDWDVFGPVDGDGPARILPTAAASSTRSGATTRMTPSSTAFRSRVRDRRRCSSTLRSRSPWPGSSRSTTGSAPTAGASSTR